jgi:hypothetical protein
VAKRRIEELGEPFDVVYYVFEWSGDEEPESALVEYATREEARNEVVRRQRSTPKSIRISYAVVANERRAVELFLPRIEVVASASDVAEVRGSPVAAVASGGRAARGEISLDEDVRLVTIGFRGRPWRVTPFHCVVGEISLEQFNAVVTAWTDAYGDFLGTTAGNGTSFYDLRYPHDRLLGAREAVARWRKLNEHLYALFYTDDHRVLDELRPGEASLAEFSGGGVLVTNFLDLPNAPEVARVGMGDYWLSRVEELRCARRAKASPGSTP